MNYNHKLIKTLQNIATFLFAKIDMRIAKRLLLLDPFLPDKEKKLIKGVLLQLCFRDEMYLPLRARHYLCVALSAIKCIETVIDGTNRKRPVKNILDLPSGYGRVSRFLQARFPDTDITVSDINAHAVRFCNKVFPVRPFKSHTDFSQLIPQKNMI